MRRSWVLALCFLFPVVPSLAGSPFGDVPVSVSKKGTLSKEPVDVKRTVDEILSRREGVYPGPGQKYRVLCPAIVKARILFTDNTSHYQRLAYLKTVCDYHQVKVKKVIEKETGQGGFLGVKKAKSANWEIEASDFTAQALCAHYGGKIDRQIRSEFVPTLPELAEITALERSELGMDRQILRLQMEYDSLIQIQSQSGVLSKERRDAGKRMKSIETEINKLKTSTRKTSEKVNQILADRILEYWKNKDYKNYYFFTKLYSYGITKSFSSMEELREKYDR